MGAGKRQRISVISMGVCLLAALSINPAHSDSNDYILVINPGSPLSEKHMKEWTSPLTRHELAEWGAGRNVTLEDDQGPVVDNIAAYVSANGSTVSIEGLRRGVRYRVWIDFVRFRYGAGGPATMLKILAAAPGTGKRLVESLVPGDTDGCHRLVLPEDISSNGSVVLTFVEYARRPGSWGVWDIIITSGPELPSRSSLPGEESINLDINDRIVQ